MLQAAAQQQASASFYALNGTSLQPLATAYTSPADPHKVRRAARLPHEMPPSGGFILPETLVLAGLGFRL